jgi:hypothetical protein
MLTYKLLRLFHLLILTPSVSVKVRPGVPDAEILGPDAKILMTRSPRPRGKNDGRTYLKCLASWDAQIPSSWRLVSTVQPPYYGPQSKFYTQLYLSLAPYLPPHWPFTGLLCIIVAPAAPTYWHL